MDTVKFVDVSQHIHIIDIRVRNKFSWEWLSLKDEGGYFFSDYIRKLDRDGLAWCCYCEVELKYGTRGLECLKSHAKSKRHQRYRTLPKANRCFPVAMHAVTEREIDGNLNVSQVTTKSLPYGASSNLDELGLPTETTSSPSDRKPISMKSSHQEAAAFPSSQSDDSSDSNQNLIGASPTTRLPEVATDRVEVKIETASTEDSPEKNDWNSNSSSAMASQSETIAPPEVATDAVLMQSDPMPADSETVKGYDFNNGIDHHAMFESMSRSGFQATNVGNAIKEINRMIDCKLQNIPEDQKSEINLNPVGREPSNCTIFLSYTSNLISSGTREAIRYVVEHNMVDCIVSSAGGIEEDFIKCLAPTYMGDFKLAGRELRKQGINRIGNLLVPNSNYCLFETWVLPILDEMLREQKEEGMLWTPSKVIHRLGKEIDNPESVYYWAYKNNIPVFCPALTDGSLGDMIYFHSYNSPGLVIDMVEDIRRMNLQAVRAVNSGMIILGGGLIKHHTCNANLMRNGADFSLFVNTGHEFDGSDSGAAPDEAISWGKIKVTAKPVKVCCDASIIFPILVAETFARRRKDYEEFYAKRE